MIRKFVPAPVKDTLKQWRYKAIGFFLDILEPLIGRYITFHTRPMRANGVLVEPDESIRDYSEYAIVIQGPLLLKNNFTLETLKLYKKYFRNAFLVLSTWEDEDKNQIDQIKKVGVEVILNKKPANPGPRNINMQITSAVAGLRKATEAGKKYVLKTRTEARIYNYNSLFFLSNLLRGFPLTAPGYKQRGRLISTHGTVHKWYFFSDMLIFGYTEDVLLYYEAALVPDDFTLKLGDAEISFTAEQYFFTEFLKKIGYSLKYNFEDSCAAQAKQCLVLEASSLDWYWCKYERFLEFRALTYRRKVRFFGFPEWYNLFMLYDKSK